MVVVFGVSRCHRGALGDQATARAAATATERLLDRLGSLAARTALLGHGLLAGPPPCWRTRTC